MQPLIQPIDTHVHFWELASYAGYDQWFAGREFLQRDYLPHHLQPELAAIGAQGAIIVGAASDSHRHNREWAQMCAVHPYVLGLVASYSLSSDHLAAWLDDYDGHPSLLGIRSQPASPPGQWADDAVADRGVAWLLARGLVLDMLVDHTRLAAAADFARKHEALTVVINHCGLPPFGDGAAAMQRWRDAMRRLAELPNVAVKYSSFVLRCHPHCHDTTLAAAAAHLFDRFGVRRLLWGSNWPPELVGGTYRHAFDTMLGAAPRLSAGERADLLRNTARRVYGLERRACSEVS